MGIQVQPVVLEKELLLHASRVLRIAYGLVEVDHTIQHLRGTNPLIDGGTTLLVVLRIVVITLERGHGTTKDVDALCVGLTDNLLVDVDDALSRLHAVLRTTQVVDGLKQDNPLHAFLSEEVALIAAQSRRT